MITIKDSGIVSENLKEKDYDFLYDVLEVIGFRWTIVALVPKKLKIFNKEKYDIIKYAKGRILLFSFSSKSEFIKINEILSSLKIFDYYITINSHINNIKKKLSEMVEYDFFVIDSYLEEYEKTIHKRTNDFLIDLDLFKTHKYNLLNLVKRYNK